jgi:hypothetical protein
MRISINCKPNIIINGDKSIPEKTTKGSFFLTKEKAGSVNR